MFVSWKNSILEYSTKTGKLLYEYKGSTDQIVGFGYHTYESFDCIIACSTSGQIHIWKTITHFKLYEKVFTVQSISIFNVKIIFFL